MCASHPFTSERSATTSLVTSGAADATAPRPAAPRSCNRSPRLLLDAVGELGYGGVGRTLDATAVACDAMRGCAIGEVDAIRSRTRLPRPSCAVAVGTMEAEWFGCYSDGAILWAVLWGGADVAVIAKAPGPTAPCSYSHSPRLLTDAIGGLVHGGVGRTRSATANVCRTVLGIATDAVDATRSRTRLPRPASAAAVGTMEAEWFACCCRGVTPSSRCSIANGGAIAARAMDQTAPCSCSHSPRHLTDAVGELVYGGVGAAWGTRVSIRSAMRGRVANVAVAIRSRVESPMRAEATASLSESRQRLTGPVLGASMVPTTGMKGLFLLDITVMPILHSTSPPCVRDWIRF